MSSYDTTLLAIARREGVPMRALLAPAERHEVRQARRLRKMARSRVTRNGWDD